MGVWLHPFLQNISFLSAEKSGQMNVSAAWDFIDSVMGVDYGYEVYQLLNVLMCWFAFAFFHLVLSALQHVLVSSVVVF